MNDPLTTHLERMVKALVMATPWVLGVRSPDSMARCVEASTGGVGALTKRRIDARVIPCAFMACYPNAGIVQAVGHNARSAYVWFLEHYDDDEPPPPFEKWESRGFFPETDAPLHVVIEAKHCGKRVLLDLTAGQAREASKGRVPVPNCIAHFGDGWPSFDLGDGATLSYGPSPCRETTRGSWRDYKCPGIVGDLDALMSIALKCNLNEAEFMKQIERVVAGGGFVPGGVEY